MIIFGLEAKPLFWRSMLPLAVRNSHAPDWEAFPELLRTEIDTYLQSLTVLRRNQAGRRLPPCKPSTIKTRRVELVAFARKAVQIGIPISEISSLAALLHPDL